jgi:two-component system, NtrC family, response regulator AtoC
VKRRILVVDDDAAMCGMLAAHLGRRGYEVTTREVAADAFELLRSSDFDAVVTDLQMRGMDGLELCERVVADRADIPVVVITAFGSLELAIAAIRAGAYDFVPKPFEIEQLCIALERAIQHRVLRAEVVRLREEAAAGPRPLDDIIGDSPAMRRVFELVRRVGESDATVLITGESGTGKELVARAVHRRSRRPDGPFVPINCAAVPEALLEAELFGHLKGAFTDARGSRPGLFLQATGGTLFLDEIGEIPLTLQPKLLRALQERRVRPVGADAEVSFDARIVAATNRDLEGAVADGRFREDLFYRINVIHIELPPLRARGADVLQLAQHLCAHFAAQSGKAIRGLSPAAAQRIASYAWPGNVRELQNCIERAVALAQYEEIVIEDLPDKIRTYRSSHVVVASDDPSELVSMEELERRYIVRVLEAVGGNKSMAARILGFDRTTLYRKMERYGLPRDPRPD